jgi:hypothetical protein
VIGGLEFDAVWIAVYRQLDARIAPTPEAVALATEVVGPGLDVLEFEFDTHGYLAFRVRSAGSTTGAVS